MRAGARWDALSRTLRAPDVLARSGDARVGAVLALLAEAGDDLRIVYTRRRDDLRTHPGQVSLPGGGVDRGETVEEAALREAHEEIGLDAATVEPLGALPALYVPPSRFWLQAVVGRWHHPHPLVRSEDEVAEILSVEVSALCDPARWRVVRLSTSRASWAWQLDDRNLLWGATGVLTVALLDALVPGWQRGLAPSDLGADREVAPWLAARAGPSRGPHFGDLPSTGVAEGSRSDRPTAAPRVPLTGERLADVARRLDAERRGVVVLAGKGGNGLAGLAAARALAAAEHPVAVVAEDAVARGLDGVACQRLGGELPEAGVVVDALVGGGLEGALRDGPLAAVRALQRRRAPIVAVDLPSGLHPREGLLGELPSADVTVALGAPQPAVTAPGLEPFIGELLVVDADGGLRRVVRAEGGVGWRE